MPSWILTWLFYYSHQPPSRSTLSLHDALPIFSPTATTSGRASSAFRRDAASGDQDRASWGCTPAVAERPGPPRASAAARSDSSTVPPITTTCPTPAARARTSTASRSRSNAASPRWQWASTSTLAHRLGLRGLWGPRRRAGGGGDRGRSGTELAGAAGIL